MESEIGRMVDEYERGRLTRRQLVAGLGSLAAVVGGVGRLLGPARAAAQESAAASTFQATELNHIALRVPDIARSRDFYIKHLGLTVSRQGDDNCFLTCGNNFVALFRGEEPGLAHYCYSVKDFDVDVAEERLRAEGFESSIRREGNRIYFDDPDGLQVQLAATEHMP